MPGSSGEPLARLVLIFETMKQRLVVLCSCKLLLRLYDARGSAIGPERSARENREKK